MRASEIKVYKRFGLNKSDSTLYNTLGAEAIEESVLGSLILESGTITDVVDELSPETFCKEYHSIVYRSILALYNKNEAIDSRTIVNQLRKDGALERVGGAAYIVALTNSISYAFHIEDHVRIIKEYYIRRQLSKLGREIEKGAHDDTRDIFNLLDKAEQNLFEVSQKNIKNSPVEVGCVIGDALRTLEQRRGTRNSITGVPSGYIELDRYILGWQRSDLVVIAARPAVGKTSLMLSFARKSAMEHGVPVAFFSLEMSSNQLAGRIISSETDISSDRIKKCCLEDYEWEKLYYKTENLSRAPIYVDDTPSLSLFEFRAKCRRLRMQKNIRLVFVDYLQLMVEGGSMRNQYNREQQIASISRGLKYIAKELGITIIVASQLSRAVEVRGGDKRPQLSDLRESGAIEQDADIVMFLYRPEYYGITIDEKENDITGMVEIIIAKHRNGTTGTFKLKYIKETTNFIEYVPKNLSF